MAMTAYFDESGTHGEASPAVIMGGFIATIAQWETYQVEISTLLQASGVKVFHAVDFRRRKNDFKNWTRAQSGQFNSKFLKLADDHMSFGLGSILASNTYKSIYRGGSGRPRRVLDSQYGLCFRVSMWRAMIFMKER